MTCLAHWYVQCSAIQGSPIFLAMGGCWMAIMNFQRQIKTQSFTDDRGVKMK